MDSPPKVATPATALTVVVPDNVPGPPEVGVPAVIDRVTALVLPVTVLPMESWTVTFGCVLKATPAVVLPGEAVKISFAGTQMTVKAVLIPFVSVPPAAARLTPVSPAAFVYVTPAVLTEFVPAGGACPAR